MKKLAILVLLVSVNLWAKGNFTVGAHGDIMRFTSYDKFVGGGGGHLLYHISDQFSFGFSVAQYEWSTGVERPAAAYSYEFQTKLTSYLFSLRMKILKDHPYLSPYFQAAFGQDRHLSTDKWTYYSLDDFFPYKTTTSEETYSGRRMAIGIGNEFKLANKFHFDLGLSYISPEMTNGDFVLSLGLNYKF